MVPLSKSTLVLEAAALSKLLEPAPQDTVSVRNRRAEPPTDRLNILYFTNNKFPFSRATHFGIHDGGGGRLLSPCRPDKSLGAFKSFQEAAEALPGNLRAERSNIIQKRRKLFLDAKVSPFYIGRNSFEGKC